MAIPKACSSTRRSFPVRTIRPTPTRPRSTRALPRSRADKPDGNSALDDYCASIAGRTFRSLAEVKRAHAKCDQGDPARDQ